MAAPAHALPYLVRNRPIAEASKSHAHRVLLLNDGQVPFDPFRRQRAQSSASRRMITREVQASSACPSCAGSTIPQRAQSCTSTIRNPETQAASACQSCANSLNSTLSAAGYEVHSVSTAQEALCSLQSSRPDLVLINLWVKDRDGKHLVESLRHWTTAPIIVM